jgi:hypothetical protein
MNAEGELLNAYREWHRLALAETKAIQTRNWNLLSDCHTAIKDFQIMVSRLTLQARAEWKRSGCNLADKEKNLHVLVSDLVELTRRNQERLQTSLAVARKQLGELGEAGNNLKRLQRSYGFVATRSQFA